MEQIIGIDLAKRVFQVHIVSTEGEKQALFPLRVGANLYLQ